MMKIEELPLPPEAKTGTIDGRYETTLDAATNTILTEMKKNYASTQEKILFLPADADAAKIFDFYGAKMTEKGFAKDASVPLQSRHFQQTVWKKDNQAVAVAVIDAGSDAEGKAIKFLAVYVGEK